MLLYNTSIIALFNHYRIVCKIGGPKRIRFGGTNPLLFRYGVAGDDDFSQVILCIDF